MKIFIKLLFIIYFCFGCKKNTEPELPECTCRDFYIGEKFNIQKGIITFSNEFNYYYLLAQEKDTTILGNFFAICPDSVFLNQLKSKGIKDSSFVKIQSNTVFYGDFDKMVCKLTPSGGDPLPLIRIKNIDKY